MDSLTLRNDMVLLCFCCAFLAVLARAHILLLSKVVGLVDWIGVFPVPEFSPFPPTSHFPQFPIFPISPLSHFPTFGGGGALDFSFSFSKLLSDFSLDMFWFGSATQHAKSDFRLQTLYTILVCLCPCAMRSSAFCGWSNGGRSSRGTLGSLTLGPVFGKL